MRKIALTSDAGQAITYHNVAERIDSRRGIELYRVPRSWRERFPEPTAFRATQAAGVELRFRADTRYVALELSAENGMAYDAQLALYHGERNVGLAGLSIGSASGRVRLMGREADIEGALDAPWRVICPYGAAVTVKSLCLSNGAELLPAESRPMRWLAHGDSITQGAHALHPGFTYVNLLADSLGWDAINLGFGGSAWGDAAVAEYIASRQDWDILSIAIGTNTFGGEKESALDYRERYETFLSIIRQAHPDKPILCVTLLWRSQDGPPSVPNSYGDTAQDYRDVIIEVVERRRPQDSQLRLLDGLEVLEDDRGLTVDRLHPDAHGMSVIAQRVAPILAEMV